MEKVKSQKKKETSLPPSRLGQSRAYIALTCQSMYLQLKNGFAFVALSVFRAVYVQRSTLRVAASPSAT